MAPNLVGVDPDGAALRFDFGDLAPAGGGAPAVLDLLFITALPASPPTIDAAVTEANSFGQVSVARAAASVAAPAPILRVQTGSLDATGPQSYFAVVGSGTGSPVAYSTWTGQFSGAVSSAAMDADPFSDRLLDVAAGDLVTFVMAVQNVSAGSAWDLVLRDTMPPGYAVPANGADIIVQTGAGTTLAATGNLFSATDGLHLDPGAPLAAYDPASGGNVVLVTFTLQATSAMPGPQAVGENRAAVIHAAASSGGANLVAAAPVSASTDVVSMGPDLSIALTGTSAAATPGSQLAVGETATFHATVTLPSGQNRAIHIGGVVPAGLSLVSETVSYATPGLTGLWVGERSTTGFDLGTVQSGQPVTVELDIVARATGASSGPVQVAVSAADPAMVGARITTAQGAAVSATAPALRLTVDGPGQVQAGQAAAYTVRLANQPGAAPAYAVRLSDLLGAGLSVVPGSVQAGGPAAGAALGTAPDGGITVDASELDPGEILTLTLAARGAGAVGTSLASQARAMAASLPGGDAAFALAPLQSASAATVAGSTAAMTLSNPAPRVGSTITLQATGVLPAGDNPAVRVVVGLPGGLTLVPGSVQATGGGTPSVAAVPGGIAVSLGPVTAPAGGGTVAVTLQAVVGVVAVGTNLASSAVVETGYGASSPALAGLVVADTPPVLAGMPALVFTVDDTAATPLSSLTLADPDVSQVQTAQVVLSNPGDGTLGNLGGGTYDAASGRYVVGGAAADVQAALRGLSFVPTARQLAYGATRTTGVSVQVSDGADGTTAAAAQVVVQGADTPPAIQGTISGQAATTTLGVLPFTALSLSDPDAGQVETLQVLVAAGLGRLAGGLGFYDPASGTYTARGTVDALQADARALMFTPAAAGNATFAITLDDGAGSMARDSGTTLHLQPSADQAGIAQHFLQLPSATFLTVAGGSQTTLVGEEYHGPVDYLRTQLIYDSADPAVIVANADSAFIKSFSGFCAIQMAGGRNVVDAGPGSNFLVDGPGNNTIFLAGNPATPTWDTIVGFHPGDTVTMFSFHPDTSSYVWADADGITGYTGRTIHADLAGDGQVTASLTFAGTTAADTAGYAVTAGRIGNLDYLAVTAA